MRRPSRPVNQKSRSGSQSIDAAFAVLNEVSIVRFPETGSIRAISGGLIALSQFATITVPGARSGICTLV